MSLPCPLCSATLSAESLEAHLRYELLLPAFRCLLCPQTFCDRGDAEEHFAGRLAEHPGVEPQLIRPPSDPAKKAQLLELLRLAEGGREAVQQRLCVCGQCRLFCREDFRPAKGPGSAPQGHLRPLDVRSSDLAKEALLPPVQAQQHHGEAEAQPVLQEPVFEEQQRFALGELASEPEDANQPPLDVKPDLADLKPQLASDGKVACLQCGLRVEKSGFYSHALKQHLPGNPFQCLLCPANAKSRSELARHQKREHKTELSAESHTRSSSKELVQEWVHLCFGEARAVAYAGLRCRPCDKIVRKMDLKVHVSAVHLRKPLYKCRLCDYSIVRAEVSSMNGHVKKVHQQRPGPATVDSAGADQYAPIIQAMIPQLFRQ